MSKTTTLRDCDIFTRKRGPQKSTKTDISAADHDNEGAASAGSMADLSTVLAELRSLRSEFSGFGTKLDSIDNRMGEMTKSVAALEKNMTEVKQNVASNVTRLEEAENRIMSAEELLEKSMADLDTAMKRIAHLEAKADDLENRGRRKNLRLFGLREGAEGQRPLLEFVREMLPRWLETDRSFIIERAHRTLAPPKPNQHRAVLIRFLNFQDREFVFRSTKQRNIEHDGNRLFFAQDFSAETIRQRAEFNTIRKVFVEEGMFRGFQYNPCKMRILHNGKTHLFSSPKEAGDFRRRHIGQD
ncbi:hypothetical protein MHYP_G00194240 [Metynnis hypsauchen]